jgi:carbon-monoxide dehydrogenase medium subunit
VQLSLDGAGSISAAGIALSSAGPCAVRVAEAEAILVGQKPTAELIRAAADAASRKSDPQADLRGSVAYKKNLAGVLVSRGLRQALARLGVQP